MKPTFYVEIYSEATKTDIANWKNHAIEWRWRMKSRNGKIVADSSEGYKNKSTMKQTIKRLFVNVPELEIKDLTYDKAIKNLAKYY